MRETGMGSENELGGEGRLTTGSWPTPGERAGGLGTGESHRMREGGQGRAHTRRAQLTHRDGRGTGVRLGRVLGYRTAVPRCVRDGRLSCVCLSVCVCGARMRCSK